MARGIDTKCIHLEEDEGLGIPLTLRSGRLPRCSVFVKIRAQTREDRYCTQGMP